MNIFNKVTLQFLKKNKTRTAVTIVGVLLSAAMITAVTTFVASMRNYALQYSIYESGDWHAALISVGSEDYEIIKSSEEVSAATYGELRGYARIIDESTVKPYLRVIAGCADSYFDMLPIHLVSGRLPENSGEIILPEHLLNRDYKAKLGDVISLELGDRMYDGAVLSPSDDYIEADEENETEGEYISVREKREYTVVGIYERPSFERSYDPGYTAITVSDGLSSNELSLDIYFKLNSPADVYNFASGNGFTCKYNTDVLLYFGISRYSNYLQILLRFAVIVIALIMFGSISLIYNAFSISVSERTKQFGLLSSIGATRKQLKHMVIFEALAVSAIGIPLGIISGIVGIGITLIAIGEKFTSVIGGSFDMPLRICVSWQSIVAAVAVALVTVLISAWIPSRRATRISAVEAIRQNIDINTKQKHRRTSRLTYKLFGLSGVLASKHYSRDRKKYRTTIISLFMSIVLFISASAFSGYLVRSVDGAFSGNKYDISYSLSSYDQGIDVEQKLYALLKSEAHTSDVAYCTETFFFALAPNEYLTEDYIDRSAASYDAPEAQGGSNSHINGYLYFVSDDEFNELLADNGLKAADYYDRSAPLGLAVDGEYTFDPTLEKYVSLETLRSGNSEMTIYQRRDIEGYVYIGNIEDESGEKIYRYQSEADKNDVLELTWQEANICYSVRTEAKITELPYFMEAGRSAELRMIYPMSMREVVVPSELSDYADYTENLHFYMISSDHAASYTELVKILSANGFNTESLYDYAEQAESERNIIIIIEVFSYGFIVLISLIAAANVFNTISTNISLRRREFAMLKSVGMTHRGFNKMMNYECLLYGTKSLILGLPVSLAVTYLIYLVASGGYEMQFWLPVTAIIVAVFSVFAVVFATMLYSMNKIKHDNPIDALKSENL